MRLNDRVAVGIVRVVAGQHLLYLVLAPRAARDDGQGPLRERLALFAPILLVGVPHAVVFEAQRGQPERRDVDTVSGNLTRKVLVLRIGPALARLYGENLARNDTPQSCGAQGDPPSLKLRRVFEKQAARGCLFQARDDEVQRLRVGTQRAYPCRRCGRCML